MSPRLTQKEQEKVAIITNPALWGEHYLKDRDGSPRKYWKHQVEDLAAKEKNIIHQDGRDCGKCSSGDTLIADVKTGRRVRIDQMTGQESIAVLGPDMQIKVTEDYEIHSNGKKLCYLLTTSSGRSIKVTVNHPFLTEKGWQILGKLEEGDWIAVPRRLPDVKRKHETFSDAHVKLLAYLIADGGLSGKSVYFTKTDPVIVDEFYDSVLKAFPGTKISHPESITYRVGIDRSKLKTKINPCAEWLRKMGLFGCRSKEKFVPDFIFQSPRRQITIFLSRLFSCDGWICQKQRDIHLEIGYCSASYQLIEGINHLLISMGYSSSIRSREVKGEIYWCLCLQSISDQKRFCQTIGFYGMKKEIQDDFMDGDLAFNKNAHDRIPSSLVTPIINKLKQQGLTWVEITGNPNRRIRLNRYNPTRWLMSEYAENTESEELHDLASSDIEWDTVNSIIPYGEQETYDLSVPGYHNFVANNIFIHNSVNITTSVLHSAFVFRGAQGLIAAPHQGHLDTLIEEIEFQIDNNPELSASIARSKTGKPKITRKPYFRIEFTNGAILYFRPAGAYGDAFRSLHVERVWADEGAWLSEKAWMALRQCLKAKGSLRIYSTPNGVRTTTYYRLTHSKQFRVFRWPSWLNPNWNEERQGELLEFYGGKDTSGWQHEVAGEHGKPSYGAFNVEHLSACMKEIVEYQKVFINGEDLNGCNSEEEIFDRLEMMLNLSPQDGVFWIGGDLGYTNDPTELVVFHEQQREERKSLKMVLRVHMEHVAYPNIAQAIALLDRYYTPVGIGVDNGGNGLAVVQELLTLDKYKSNQLEGRLKGLDFGGMTTLGFQDGREVKKRTKELMTTLINGALQRRELAMPSDDLDIEDQFTTQTYILRDGKVIYSKGNDHIIDAVRCGMLIREKNKLEDMGEETVSLKPVLTNPIFF